MVGMAGGIAATQSGVGNLERVVVWSALFAAMLRYATPLIFASLGGLFSERSGVINIALEGMLLTGAFFAVLGADLTGTWYLGVLIGMAAGGLLALIHAIFSVSLRADQIVSGTALNFLAFGITTYLYLNRYGAEGTPTDLPQVPDVHLPLIEDIAFVGDIFGQLNLLIWMGLALVLVTWVVVFRTPPGLRLRAAGENPLAAETAGLSVVKTRYLAVVTSGVLAGAGGAYLSIGFVHSFSQNMTIGKGFIALAALIFGRWRPGRRADGGAAVRLLDGARAAAAGVLAVGRDAVPGAALRADAGRRGGPRRPLDPAGRDRPPARALLEDPLLEPALRNAPRRVEARGERAELGQPREARGELVAARVEELAPVRARLERGQRGLDDVDRAVDRLRLARPREVDPERGPAVLRAQPEIVRGHRAQLADQHRRADLRRGRAQRLDRGGRVAARHVVLGLQLLAVARRELQAEVGEPLRPRAGAAELRRGV